MRILLVEDHADTAKLLGRLLGRMGYVVLTAGTVARALDLAETETFDLVISDVGLPDASGYDLMRQVGRKHGGDRIAIDQQIGVRAIKPARCQQPTAVDELLQVFASTGKTARY